MTNNDLIMKNPRPTRADAVKNRSLLLQTASKLFARLGVDAVSMTQIAQEAGVGKGTLYRHFSNKSDLCHALLDEDMRILQEQTLQRLNSDEMPVNMLRWFLTEIVYFVDRNMELLSSAREVNNMSSLEFPAHLWWWQTIRGLLNRIGFDQDIAYYSDILYVMVDVNTLRFQRQHHSYDLNRILSGLMAVIDQLACDS